MHAAQADYIRNQLRVDTCPGPPPRNRRGSVLPGPSGRVALAARRRVQCRAAYVAGKYAALSMGAETARTA
jgi:hypothetical protein